MGRWWLRLACCMVLAGCGADECSEELRIAIEIMFRPASGVRIQKVTAERQSEEECGSFFNAGAGQVFTCWEQGGGTYLVRVYSAGQVVHEQALELEADACHVKERVLVEIDLTAAAAAL